MPDSSNRSKEIMRNIYFPFHKHSTYYKVNIGTCVFRLFKTPLLQQYALNLSSAFLKYIFFIF